MTTQKGNTMEPKYDVEVELVGDDGNAFAMLHPQGTCHLCA